MLNFKRKTETVNSSTAVVLAQPTPIELETGVFKLDTYKELAGNIGFEPAALFEEDLLRFMKKEAIPRYNYDEVSRYMTALADTARKTDESIYWIWKPLRPQDVAEGFNILGVNGNSYGTDGYYDSSKGECRPYHRAVPIHILRHVEKIHDKFGDQAKFFVTDFAVPEPDPFIMVTALDVDSIVFGVWDEPGFGVEEPT